MKHLRKKKKKERRKKMKLQNKKTGGIVDAHEIDLINNYVYLKIFRAGDYDTKQYNSLAELCEEWEDYEETKVGYIVDPMEEDCVSEDDSGYEESDVERAKELGIWFETEEEAEKAVEKLKAWKRLQDKGFKINDWNMAMRELSVEVPEKFFDKQGPITMGISDETKSDLDLLFGGEE